MPPYLGQVCPQGLEPAIPTYAIEGIVNLTDSGTKLRNFRSLMGLLTLLFARS
jgi:hypothetical protein